MADVIARPLRGLFIATDGSPLAGVTRSLVDLLGHLDRRVIEPYLVCPWSEQGEPGLSDEAQALGIPCWVRHLDYWVPPASEWGLGHLRRFFATARARQWALSHLAREVGADFVYTNALTSIDGALLAKREGLPHFWHLREFIGSGAGLRPYLPETLVKRLVLALSARVIVNSQEWLSAFPPGSEKVTLLHDGVDVRHYASRRKPEGALRRELGLDPSAVLVAAIGRVSPHKGQDMLVRAAQRVCADRADVHFLLVGPAQGEYADAVRGLVGQLGLAERVRFLGPRQDVPDLLGDIDMLALTSTEETFGRVLVEAMINGRAVVATRCGGPQDIVTDGETGFLVPVADPAALAERILRLAGDPVLRASFGERGRERALGRFSAAAIARRFEQLVAGQLRTRGDAP